MKSRFSIYEFSRLPKVKREKVLIIKGLFLEIRFGENRITGLYYLPGFYVEVITCKSSGHILHITPYIRCRTPEKYGHVKHHVYFKRNLLISC